MTREQPQSPRAPHPQEGGEGGVREQATGGQDVNQLAAGVKNDRKVMSSDNKSDDD